MSVNEEENDDIYLSDQEHEEDSSGSDHDNSSEAEEGNNNDGLAEMMSKILNQKVNNNKIPVLAKRKTAIMKEIADQSQFKEENKVLRLERKRKREKFLAVPDHLSTDFERQLRKVATRGG